MHGVHGWQALIYSISGLYVHSPYYSTYTYVHGARLYSYSPRIPPIQHGAPPNNLRVQMATVYI